MANSAALSVVGLSIERFLSGCLRDPSPVENFTVPARLVSTGDLDPNNLSTLTGAPCLSVFMYRVELNKTTRAGWSAVGSLDGRSHVPVDMHFLLTPWAKDAAAELRILGRAMQAIDTTPILSGPLLFPDGGFAPGESIQLVPEDVSTEGLMRLFDSLPIDYRLSVPYLARIVRIDSRVEAPSPPVLTAVSGTSSSAAPPPPSRLTP